MNARESYHAGIIIASSAGCIVPQELFLLNVWNESGWFAASIVAISIAVSAVIGWSLPAGYFKLRRFEMSGRLYERLGIRTFRRFVPDGDIAARLARRRGGPRESGMWRPGVAWLEKRGRLAEACHLAGTLSIVPVALHALMLDQPVLALWMVSGTLMCHTWPALLQRYTRGRLLRVAPRYRKESNLCVE